MKNVLSIIMILILSIFLAGCDKDIEFVNTTPDTNDTNDTDVGHKAPVADAGDDENTTVGTSIEIVGKFIVGDGDIIGYEWKEGSVLRSGLKKFTYTAPSKEGKHTLTFTVYDSNDKKSSDTMTITVEEVNASK